MLHVQNRCGADHPAIEPSGSVTDLIIVPTMMESAHKITKPSIKNNFFVQKHKLRRSFLIFVVSIGIKFEGGKKAYLHIQTETPAGQMPGLRSNSAGLSVSCRKGSPTQSGTQGLDPQPESPAASGGCTPSGGAAL